MRTREERKTRRALKARKRELTWLLQESRQIKVSWAQDITRINNSLKTGEPFITAERPIMVLPAGATITPPPPAYYTPQK